MATTDQPSEPSASLIMEHWTKQTFAMNEANAWSHWQWLAQGWWKTEVLPTEDSCDGGDDDGGDEKVSNDLPTEESLLVKLSSGADVALVKWLLVKPSVRKGRWWLTMVSKILSKYCNCHQLENCQMGTREDYKDHDGMTWSGISWFW